MSDTIVIIAFIFLRADFFFNWLSKFQAFLLLCCDGCFVVGFECRFPQDMIVQTVDGHLIMNSLIIAPIYRRRRVLLGLFKLVVIANLQYSAHGRNFLRTNYCNLVREQV